MINRRFPALGESGVSAVRARAVAFPMNGAAIFKMSDANKISTSI